MGKNSSPHLSTNLNSNLQIKMLKRKLRSEMGLLNPLQLLVRLERLLRGVPSDPLKRRSHEQSVVPWLPEDTVKLCPSCAKSFNIARRYGLETTVTS